MSIFDEKLKGLRTALEFFDSNTPILDDSYKFDGILRECVTILKSSGYTVKKIPERIGNIKGSRDLVDHFYFVFPHFIPDVSVYREDKVDLKIAKDFINKIKDSTGYSYEVTLSLCARLVEVVIKYNKEFNFEPGTFYNFRVFGQGKTAWVTEKAIRIYNRIINDEEKLIKQAEEEIERYEKEHDIKFGYGSVEEIQKLIDEFKE